MIAQEPYSDKWREGRKLFHQNFRAEASNDFRTVQTQQVRGFVSQLLTSSGFSLKDQIST